MKNRIIKTTTIALVALGTNAMAVEAPHALSFGSSVGGLSIERQVQIEASKSTIANDEMLVRQEPPCRRQCTKWEIVEEKNEDKDLLLAEDLGSLLS